MYDGVVQGRRKGVANKMKQLLDGRNDPLKNTESDVSQLNVTNSVLTDNKELNSDFKKIDCTSKNNNLLKNVFLDNITNNQKLRSRKNRTYAEAVQVQKIFVANLLRMPKR